MWSRSLAAASIVVIATSMLQATEPEIDVKAGTVTLEAVVADQGKYEVLKGTIEYLLVAEGGKSYETVFVTRTQARTIREALIRIGLKPGKPATDETAAQGTPVDIVVEYESDGTKVMRPASDFVTYTKTGKVMSEGAWIFTGSRQTLDPETDKKRLEAAITGNLIGLHVLDASVLIQSPRAEAADENIYKANVDVLPKAGTALRIIIQKAEVPEGMRRVHLFISGRVQGVGFRAFTQRNARQLELTGWVQNLKDGRVETVIEGSREKVAKLLKLLERGPRGARVKKTEINEEPYQGEFEAFEVHW